MFHLTKVLLAVFVMVLIVLLAGLSYLSLTLASRRRHPLGHSLVESSSATVAVASTTLMAKMANDDTMLDQRQPGSLFTSGRSSRLYLIAPH